MVKRRHAIDAARRQLQLVGNEQQQVVFKIAEKFLRLVQHLDQRVLPELVLLHVHFQNLEALVAAGVLLDLGGHCPFFAGNGYWHNLILKYMSFVCVCLMATCVDFHAGRLTAMVEAFLHTNCF